MNELMELGINKDKSCIKKRKSRHTFGELNKCAQSIAINFRNDLRFQLINFMNDSVNFSEFQVTVLMKGFCDDWANLKVIFVTDWRQLM